MQKVDSFFFTWLQTVDRICGEKTIYLINLHQYYKTENNHIHKNNYKKRIQIWSEALPMVLIYPV